MIAQTHVIQSKSNRHVRDIVALAFINSDLY
jgi:hypothetical protein